MLDKKNTVNSTITNSTISGKAIIGIGNQEMKKSEEDEVSPDSFKKENSSLSRLTKGDIFSNTTDDIDREHIFIVHGHNSEAKEKTARFIEKLGFKPIILSEQPSRGLTIIEKIEKYSNVGFAIVLYTPDDLGNTQSKAIDGNLLVRARQNVIFEHGFLIGKIGRKNVVPLVAGDLELPSDIRGMVYINDKDWQVDIARDMKDAGYPIDFNKLL